MYFAHTNQFVALNTAAGEDRNDDAARAAFS